MKKISTANSPLQANEEGFLILFRFPLFRSLGNIFCNVLNILKSIVKSFFPTLLR